MEPFGASVTVLGELKELIAEWKSLGKLASEWATANELVEALGDVVEVFLNKLSDRANEVRSRLQASPNDPVLIAQAKRYEARTSALKAASDRARDTLEEFKKRGELGGRPTHRLLFTVGSYICCCCVRTSAELREDLHGSLNELVLHSSALGHLLGLEATEKLQDAINNIPADAKTQFDRLENQLGQEFRGVHSKMEDVQRSLHAQDVANRQFAFSNAYTVWAEKLNEVPYEYRNRELSRLENGVKLAQGYYENSRNSPFDQARVAGRSVLDLGRDETTRSICSKYFTDNGYAELLNVLLATAPMEAANACFINKLPCPTSWEEIIHRNYDIKDARVLWFYEFLLESPEQTVFDVSNEKDARRFLPILRAAKPNRIEVI